MAPIVHHPLYDAASVPDGHRFPMRKYTRLAELLVEEGHVVAGAFHTPILAPASWIETAHDPAYVRAVIEGGLDRQAQRRIGFEWSPHVADRARASSSGTLLAARLALEHGAAGNAAGGSHHADRFGGAGFCVFNDVAVAAAMLLAENEVKRILIVDCDVHQGDGTARIFADDPRVFTFSIHCEENWPRDKPPSDLDVGLPPQTGDEDYLDRLAASLRYCFDEARPDLVMYNAGVDPHADDRLGLLSLSDAGIAARDRMVTDACFRAGAPVAGVLGGGYSDDPDAVARRHLYLFEALAAYGGAA